MSVEDYSQIKEWGIADAAVFCDLPGATGQIFYGPHPMGAQAIFPHGSSSRTPEPDTYAHDGWRHGIWRSHDSSVILPNGELYKGIIWRDGSEMPDSLQTVGITGTVDILIDEAPLLINEVKRMITKKAQEQLAALELKSNGLNKAPRTDLIRRINLLHEMRADAEEAFGINFVNRELYSNIKLPATS